ncbi:hypothetical protein HPB52_013100 [Rhipicephalus sanguineus]|uniref:Uncharacterized protein n=1 Tax=Rhipicephalus sanguineus TaxID=34632 RepID=A0A9D4Q007_RHISA|nr:hypothetical protein HPB52_013100 [Rhipicephalus sanguineus]
MNRARQHQLTEKIDLLTEQLESKTWEIKELEDVASKLRQQVSEAGGRQSLRQLFSEEPSSGLCKGSARARRALLTAEKNSDRARRDYAELLQTWQNYENSNDAGEVEVYRTDYDTERNLRRQLETTVQQHLNTIEELREQINALQEPPPELRSSHSSNSSNQR